MELQSAADIESTRIKVCAHLHILSLPLRRAFRLKAHDL
jgi:hypothetical protein